MHQGTPILIAVVALYALGMARIAQASDSDEAEAVWGLIAFGLVIAAIVVALT